MRQRVAVIGAGPSGLAAAVELAAAADVTLVDRLPATGGMTGWEDASVRRLTEDCRRAGVETVLGTTALRWQDGRLLVAAPASIRWIPFAHVVVATGCRPATRAELRLAGSRAAGVHSALVAIHLLEAGALLGRHVAVVGVTDWGERAAHLVHEHGGTVVAVAPPSRARLPSGDTPRPDDAAARPSGADEGRSPLTSAARPSGADEAPPPWAEAWWPGWEPVAVAGRRRVSGLIVERDAVQMSIRCDAVVLAADPRPLRNVDGALVAGPDVSFIQEFEPDMATKIARSATLARDLVLTLKGATA